MRVLISGLKPPVFILDIDINITIYSCTSSRKHSPDTVDPLELVNTALELGPPKLRECFLLCLLLLLVRQGYYIFLEILAAWVAGACDSTHTYTGDKPQNNKRVASHNSTIVVIAIMYV